MNPAAVDPNIVPSLVAILAHTGDATRYEEFDERFRTAATPQEERRYLFSLAAFQPKALLERTLAAPSAEKSAHKTRRFSSAPSWAMSMAESWPGIL